MPEGAKEESPNSRELSHLPLPWETVKQTHGLGRVQDTEVNREALSLAIQDHESRLEQ